MTRDLAKTATFAALHFAVGFGVSYAFTGSVAIATGIALVEPAVNTIVFFLHERAWRMLPARLHSRLQARILRNAPAIPSGGL
jgi:uncharacterized membrane protein